MGVVIVAAQQRDTITDTELCGQSEHLYQLILIKRKSQSLRDGESGVAKRGGNLQA